MHYIGNEYNPNRHLPIQSQEWENQSNVQN